MVVLGVEVYGHTRQHWHAPEGICVQRNERCGCTPREIVSAVHLREATLTRSRIDYPGRCCAVEVSAEVAQLCLLSGVHVVPELAC